MNLKGAVEHLEQRCGESVITKDGLFDLGWYLGYTDGKEKAVLDGKFTSKDLMAIATYMAARWEVVA